MSGARALAGVLAALVLAASPSAARGTRAGPTPFPSSVGISRVRVEVRGERALVTTDVLISGAAKQARALDAFVAWGMPGPPQAIDAELVAVPADRLSAPADARGRRVELRAATHAPAHAAIVLGPGNMAGSRATIDRDALAAALAAGGSATLRIRAVHALQARIADGARDLLLYLGARDGAPFILGAIEIDGDALTLREARLCGPHADPTPLGVLPRHEGDAPALAPPLAPRSLDDALCVRVQMRQKESDGDGVSPVDSR